MCLHLTFSAPDTVEHRHENRRSQRADKWHFLTELTPTLELIPAQYHNILDLNAQIH